MPGREVGGGAIRGTCLTDPSARARRPNTVVEAEQSSVHVTTGIFGDAVEQTYPTRFTDGAATELLNWAIRDGKAVLVGYRIQSPQLIIG
jgi:hypothetical protein